MDAVSLESLITGLVAGAGAALGAWGAVTVHLSYHRRDIDRAQSTADRAHERLNRLRCRAPDACNGPDARQGAAARG